MIALNSTVSKTNVKFYNNKTVLFLVLVLNFVLKHNMYKKTIIVYSNN